MRDTDCVRFLQWCLPRLRLRWPGFRRVRRQVCKRIDRRLSELGIPDAAAYCSYLERHPDEWSVLDGLCRISISRFYRDRRVFQALEGEVLPALGRMAEAQGATAMRCWSAGCAAGEEPYTLAILWALRLAARLPSLGLTILATDADPQAIERAAGACFPATSLKELPGDLRAGGLLPVAGGFCVRDDVREMVTLREQDIRAGAPDGPFHLILCRNVAFTYFDDALQRETLQKITERLLPGGALVIGRREHLPDDSPGLQPWSQDLGIYRRVPERDGRAPDLAEPDARSR